MNTATDHENRIHSEAGAAQFGFRSGLVPGVNVYGYLTVPVVRRHGVEWLERGWMRVRFRKPFYDGEVVVVRAREEGEGIQVDAERASGEAGLHNEAPPMPLLEHPLPELRPDASPDLIQAGLPLGSFTTDLREAHDRITGLLRDPLPIYGEFAHPTVLLGLANDILVRNFILPAWIHTASDVRAYEAARADERVNVRGRIRDVFTQKGHEFLIAEVSVVNSAGKLLHQTVHVAIWRLRAS